MTTAGAILCGGRSRRMGRDKAHLTIGGEAVLARIANRLSTCLDRVAVVAGRDQLLPALPPDISVLRDEVDYAGPLHGLRMALQDLPPEFDLLFLTACDAPFPQMPLVCHLFELSAEAEAVVPQVGGKVQPLFAVYRRDVLSKIDAIIAEDRRSMRDLIERCDRVRVGESELRRCDPELRSFRNINTPEDYERALEMDEALKIGG